MTNQADLPSNPAFTFQTAPTIIQSDELSFVEDAASLIAQLAMGSFQLKNIEDAPHIVLTAEPSKRIGYNIRSVTTMENDRNTELCDTYSTYIFHDIPAYAVDQVMRHANMSSMALAIYKSQSLELIKQARAVQEQRLPSVPYNDMTTEEIEKLPLPYLITSEKHVVLSLLDEEDNLVSVASYEADQEAQQNGFKDAQDALDDLLLSERERKEKKQRQKEEEKREQEIDDKIDQIREEMGVELQRADSEDNEPAYKYNDKQLIRGLSAEVAGGLLAAMEEIVRIPSEFMCVLDYDKENKPSYVLLGVEPSGVKEMLRIQPEQGELVSIATKVLTNLHEDILEKRIREDGKHHQMRGLSDFDCNKIENFAAVFDRVHCAKLGWNG